VGRAHGFGKVRRLLHSAGHEVFTPSLTGIGERAHLASPQVCLTTHIADVANAVLYEDLRDIVLLGFSYGGLVITGALEHIAGRVSHLVYLDAFVPADGESLDSITGATSRSAAIGRPYFFSMDGKYDAGPFFGHGGACSTMLTCSFLWPQQ
jgi:pimeloyl-ACP methyl ester carboxylesterase